MTAPGRIAEPVAGPVSDRVPTLPGELCVERLENGLTVALAHNPQAPLVTTALCYRAGARHEAEGHGGTAHFLEHMMFKGSARFGPGEVDRLTRRLGGSNNAFTSHDSTTYYFSFAADRWQAALEIEADRMAGLTLDEREVEAERRVILEEIAMYEDDPWDALTRRVEAALFGAHPYGRPVLGSAEELRATGASELAAFHRRRYRPDRAVLVVAGDLGTASGSVLGAVETAFGDLPPRAAPDGDGPEPGAAGRPGSPAVPPPRGPVRIERRRGEVPRLLLAFPAPAASDPRFPAARLLATLLGGGRGSRLVRALVDEEQLCSWVAADVREGLDPTALSVVAEPVPEASPEAVEERLRDLLAGLGERPPAAEEVERARQVLYADWALGHERIAQQALSVASDLALFGLGWTERTLEAVAELGPAEVQAAAAELLVPSRSVVGWSLPADRAA